MDEPDGHIIVGVQRSVALYNFSWEAFSGWADCLDGEHILEGSAVRNGTLVNRFVCE